MPFNSRGKKTELTLLENAIKFQETGCIRSIRRLRVENNAENFTKVKRFHDHEKKKLAETRQHSFCVITKPIT